MNLDIEYHRNMERYTFLKWGQQSLANFQAVPPSRGIVHQVNLEFLASVARAENNIWLADTLVGTDSHTTMDTTDWVLMEWNPTVARSWHQRSVA